MVGGCFSGRREGTYWRRKAYAMAAALAGEREAGTGLRRARKAELDGVRREANGRIAVVEV